jgi:hypothetical protein
VVGSTAAMAITVTIEIVIFCEWSLFIVVNNYEKPFSFYELSQDKLQNQIIFGIYVR